MYWIVGHILWTSINYFLSNIILEFLNGCTSFNIGPINAKLENVAYSFNVLLKI